MVAFGLTADTHRRQRAACGQPRTFFTAPAAALKVADQNRFLARQRRLGQDAARHLQRRAESRRRRRRRRHLHRGNQAILLGRRTERDVRARRKEHDRGPIRRSQAVDRVTRRGLGAVPAIRIPHAVALVEQHDDFARGCTNGRGRIGPPEKRPGERRDDQHQRRQTHAQEGKVAKLSPPDGLIRYPPHEHQRRKLLDHLLLALGEVNQHRYRESGEAEEEEGG